MPKMKAKRYRGFYLETATDEHLRHACAAQDITVSEFVRNAVIAQLERQTVSV